MASGDVVRLHPVDPEPRLLARAAEVVRGGGVIAYPTDSIYALGSRRAERAAAERARRLRGEARNPPFRRWS